MTAFHVTWVRIVLQKAWLHRTVYLASKATIVHQARLWGTQSRMPVQKATCAQLDRLLQNRVHQALIKSFPSSLHATLVLRATTVTGMTEVRPLNVHVVTSVLKAALFLVRIHGLLENTTLIQRESQLLTASNVLLAITAQKEVN